MKLYLRVIIIVTVIATIIIVHIMLEHRLDEDHRKLLSNEMESLDNNSFKVLEEYNDSDIRVILYEYRSKVENDFRIGISIIESGLGGGNLSSGYPKNQIEVTTIHTNGVQKYIIYGYNVDWSLREIIIEIENEQFNVMIDEDGSFLEVITKRNTRVFSNVVEYKYHLVE